MRFTHAGILYILNIDPIAFTESRIENCPKLSGLKKLITSFPIKAV